MQREYSQGQENVPGLYFLIYNSFRIILEIILGKAVDNMWGK